MGIKGTVRRSTDGDFIHANVDIDLIIDEEPVVSEIQYINWSLPNEKRIKYFRFTMEKFYTKTVSDKVIFLTSRVS